MFKEIKRLIDLHTKCKCFSNMEVMSLIKEYMKVQLCQKVKKLASKINLHVFLDWNLKSKGGTRRSISRIGDRGSETIALLISI